MKPKGAENISIQGAEETQPTRKQSFTPISDMRTRILILGSLPGERSLQASEYYAHPGNRFWKIISGVTGSEIPIRYEDKLSLLIANGIGLWDVVREASREGSLDARIKHEVPNDLEALISSRPMLSTIIFNGKTAERLFDKYYRRIEGLRYVSLPSTSPANAAFSFEVLFERWQSVLSEK